jgi:hypothetical protein
MSILFALACGPRAVEIRGTVYDGPASAEPAAEGSAIRIRDAEAAAYDQADVGADGSFSVDAPEGADIFAEVVTPGFPNAVFGGYAGLSDFEAVPGSLYSAQGIEDWLVPFAGCPGLGEGGAVVGEVVFSDLRDPETGASVPVYGAIVSVAIDGRDDQLVPACYLDDEGAAYAPDADVAGSTARFAVVGLPPGFHQLRIGFQAVESGFDFTFWEVWLPDGGINPWFPAEIGFLE